MERGIENMINLPRRLKKIARNVFAASRE